MKTLSKYILFILLMCLAHFMNAQDDDAVYNKLVKTYTLHQDGSTEYREYKEVKLVSHMSFHRLFGETFIIYDPEYQEIVINEAYTIMKDGKKVVVPGNAFNEVLPRAAAGAPAYNRLRELVITHTGLEVGAIIYLDYTLKTKAGFMPAFMGEEMIRERVPVKDLQIAFRMGRDRDLHYKVLNMRTAPEVSQEEGMNVYTFTFKDIKEYAGGWGNDNALLPRLFFSAAKDLERAYFPFVAQPAFTYPATDDMKSEVEKLMEDNEDELLAMLAIQKLVVDETATWDIPAGYTAFRCREPEEVWNSNGGTPLEKTVLLATLLREAGFDAYPVAVIPSMYYDRTVGSLYMMKDFAVQVKPRDEMPYYISAVRTSSQDLGQGMAGKKLLILDGAIESLKVYEPDQAPAEMTFKGSFILDEEANLTGKMKVSLSGNANPYFSLYQDSAYAKRYGSGVKNTELLKLGRDESTFELEIEKEDAFEDYGSYFFMEIPLSRSGISSWGLSYIETDRVSPIRLEEPLHEAYDLEIELPDNFTMISPEKDLNIDNEVGSLVIRIGVEGNKVKLERQLTFKKEHVSHEDLDALGQLIGGWVNPVSGRLLFKSTD